MASRPSWRCAACGSAWPCSSAKLRLLAEYRGNRPGLLVYLAALWEEAAAQLADVHDGEPPTDLHRRFMAWVPDR